MKINVIDNKVLLNLTVKEEASSIAIIAKNKAIEARNDTLNLKNEVELIKNNVETSEQNVTDLNTQFENNYNEKIDSINNTVNSGIQSIEEISNDNINQINDLKDNIEDSVNQAQSIFNNIETETNNSISQIQSEKNTSITEIQNEKTDSLNELSTELQSGLNQINDLKSETEELRDEAIESNNNTQSLLVNFFDPAIIALNSRINNDSGEVVRKLRFIQNDLDNNDIFNEASLVLSPSSFSNSKLHSVLPQDGTGDFDVSRNGTGTYFDRNGILQVAQPNQPRFNFDPLTGDFKGVLVEPSGVNLITNSKGFDSFTNVLDAPDIIRTDAPFGKFGNIGTELQLKTENGWLNYNFSAVQNTFYTISFYVRNIDATGIRITFASLASSFSPSTTDLPVNNFSNYQHIEEDIYRVWLTTHHIGENGTRSFRFGVGTGFTGGKVVVYGLQLEAGSTPTSYIPTSGSQVTRPADVNTRTNIADLIGQEQGSVFVEFFNITAPNRRVMGISDGTIQNRVIILINSPNTPRAIVTVDGVSQFDRTGASIPEGMNKIVITYKQNDIRFYVNGFLVFNQDSGNVPSCNNMYLGKQETNNINQILTSSIKKATLFKRALTDEEAIKLTTL
ncbi:phage head spike fiber domain-containing protein [Arthrospiribacter ruber]|uniref:Uncharacterized protein n=1 Tax=Arthrospiribacter ruber TaxID=2487934 RepID=A0A951IZF9_9BACT|nr:LamG-like jellyroll fold domain-containing protein [Arthrospiribacter ruber]MBW3469084.1 hypothetical protein [Arthrospiribacter ruber]